MEYGTGLEHDLRPFFGRHCYTPRRSPCPHKPEKAVFTNNERAPNECDGTGEFRRDSHKNYRLIITGVVIDTITVGEEPESVAFSRNGKYAYVVNNESATVSVIKTR